MLFPIDKKIIYISRNEGLAEKYVPVKEWTVSTGRRWLLSEKMKENGKSVSTRQNETFWRRFRFLS